MTVSIKDIARAMNISYSTVSRALNNSPRVKAETRQQIQQLAATMGYLPSAVARSLVTRRTNTLGIVVTKITDLFFAEVIQGIEEAALSYGYSIILTNSAGQPEYELAAIQSLRERRVDGIILVAACASTESKQRLFSQPLETPIVIINNVHQEHIGFSVETDNLQGGCIATQHLLDLGHRRIAYIAGPVSEWDSVERQQGYVQTLQAAGVVVDSALMIRGDNLPAGGFQAMHQLLALPTPPSAIFCYNDVTALGAMRAAYSAGKSVPQDISIVGFDDISLAAYFEPPLTTVAQAKLEMGEKAVQMVLDLLAGQPVMEKSVLPSRLIVRASSQAFR